tara:strand:+ start:342 stop:1088 length:747 start_codon:yes stop_codon:yes gene_type:complete
MVNIDTVYQKVLVLSNKEQRGYITPQEFNLMADKAQLEIFENYFHDLKTAFHKPKNDTIHSDEMEILSEKLQIFKSQDVNTNIVTGNDGIATNTINLNILPVPIYRLDSVIYNYTASDSTQKTSEMLELTRKENNFAENNPLTKATKSRPTFVRQGGKIIRVYPMPSASDSLDFYYWRKPTTPKWGYVVVNGKALYNYKSSTNFEIHTSEEENLVTRILALSGIIINNPGLMQVGMAEKVSTKQDQND